jgi:hypothetical protein
VENSGGKHATEWATLSVALLLAERVPFTIGALIPDYVVIVIEQVKNGDKIRVMK